MRQIKNNQAEMPNQMGYHQGAQTSTVSTSTPNRMRSKHAGDSRSTQSNDNVWRDEVNLGCGPLRCRGAVRALYATIPFFLLGGLAGYWLYLKIKLANERAKQKIPSDDTITDELSDNPLFDNKQEVMDWLDYWHLKFPYNLISLPPIISDYVVDCPDGFQEAIIAQLTAELGAICFSRVRAKYLDGTFHRPSLLVIVEGFWGSGKGKLKEIHNSAFSRRIKRDMDKIGEIPSNNIIQTISADVSFAKLIDLLANNKEVHAVLFDSEVRTMVDALKKSNGLTWAHIRKAFDNDTIERMNKDKNAPQGFFPIALNMVLTGTPEETKDFTKKELEGGTTSRFCWLTLPKVGENLAVHNLPEGKVLEQIHNEIDNWANEYSYYTDSEGNDIPATQKDIDLSYVNKRLQLWLDRQYQLSKEEGNPARREVRARIGAIAFRSAIVYHMLYGEPSAKDRGARQEVINLTIYMANYYMERFLHKFGTKQNEQRAKITAEEMVSIRDASNTTGQPKKYTIPDGADKGQIWAELRDKLKKENPDKGYGYGTIAAMYGCSKSKVVGAVRRYRKKQNS